MRIVVARVGRKSAGSPRWSYANWRSSCEIVRKPADVSRLFSVSGNESPIQFSDAFPEWLSKGSTSTTRPPVSPPAVPVTWSGAWATAAQLQAKTATRARNRAKDFVRQPHHRHYRRSPADAPAAPRLRGDTLRQPILAASFRAATITLRITFPPLRRILFACRRRHRSPRRRFHLCNSIHPIQDSSLASSLWS